VDCQRHAAQSHSAPLCGAFGLTRDDGGFAAIGDSRLGEEVAEVDLAVFSVGKSAG
jgi:hypothetical protein